MNDMIEVPNFGIALAFENWYQEMYHDDELLYPLEKCNIGSYECYNSFKEKLIDVVDYKAKINEKYFWDWINDIS